jgi:poly-gamma-glutamate synthesis protein (capsule biosynthesis protein)
VLRGGDVVFGNLEATLSDGEDGSLFASPTSSAALLREAGFTVLHVANNHVYDYGAAGLRSTLDAMSAAGLLALGAGVDRMACRAAVRIESRGVRLGWLGCGRTQQPQAAEGPNFWEFNEGELLAEIRRARETVDVLVVSIHIGFMYLEYPHPDHKALAERCTEAGADLLLMHHAHVLQGVQMSSGRVACYGLGNFLFDSQEGLITNVCMVREQNEGAVFAFDVDRSGICRAAALPTYLDDQCRLHWAVGEHGRAVLDRLAQLSANLDGDWASLFWRQRSERNTGHILRMLRYYLRNRRWSEVRRMMRKVRGQHLRMLAHWLAHALRAPLRRWFYA